MGTVGTCGTVTCGSCGTDTSGSRACGSGLGGGGGGLCCWTAFVALGPGPPGVESAELGALGCPEGAGDGRRILGCDP